MKKKVGIRFKPAGKIYDFDSGAFVLGPGDQVIVETEKGLGFGTVVIPPVCERNSHRRRNRLKKVVRLASPKDSPASKRTARLKRGCLSFLQGARTGTGAEDESLFRGEQFRCKPTGFLFYGRKAGRLSASW
jgi:hypothetical protein